MNGELRFRVRHGLVSIIVLAHAVLWCPNHWAGHKGQSCPSFSRISQDVERRTVGRRSSPYRGNFIRYNETYGTGKGCTTNIQLEHVRSSAGEHNTASSSLLTRHCTRPSRADICHWPPCQKSQDPDPEAHHFSSTSRHAGCFEMC